MDAATFWSVAIAFNGLFGAALYAFLTWKARKKVKPAAIVLGVIIVATCAYPAITWGGQLLGWWTITPEIGRPALAMVLSALSWLGILAYGQKQ